MQVKSSHMVEMVLGVTFTFVGCLTLILGLVLYPTISRDSVMLALLFPTVFFLVFGGIGGGFLLKIIGGKRRMRRLVRDGDRYDCEITDVYHNRSYHVNGRHPLVVECRYQNRRGEKFLVKSGNLWPPIALDIHQLSARVYVDRDNPKKYYVEINCHPRDWEDLQDLR